MIIATKLLFEAICFDLFADQRVFSSILLIFSFHVYFVIVILNDAHTAVYVVKNYQSHKYDDGKQIKQ